jgi:hypothetical protein
LNVKNKDKSKEMFFLFQCKYSKNDENTLKWSFLKEISNYFVSYKEMIENKKSINGKIVDHTFKFVHITNRRLDSKNNVINHFKKINRPTNFIYDYKDAEYFQLCDYHDVLSEENLKIDEFAKKFILITRFDCNNSLIDDINENKIQLSENLDIDNLYKGILEQTTKKTRWIDQTQIESLMLKNKRKRSQTNENSSKKKK